MHGERQAEGARDALRRDVVMRRADAARREHVIEFRAQLVDGGDDDVGTSGMTRASRSTTPAAPSPLARKLRFASCVRPDRISLPITSTAAVTVFGASAAAVIGVSLGLS